MPDYSDAANLPQVWTVRCSLCGDKVIGELRDGDRHAKDLEPHLQKVHGYTEEQLEGVTYLYAFGSQEVRYFQPTLHRGKAIAQALPVLGQ